MVALTIRISWWCDIFYRTRVVLACLWNTTIFNSTYLQANVNYKKRNIVKISGISTIILCALVFPFRLPLCSCSLTSAFIIVILLKYASRTSHHFRRTLSMNRLLTIMEHFLSFYLLFTCIKYLRCYLLPLHSIFSVSVSASVVEPDSQASSSDKLTGCALHFRFASI